MSTANDATELREFALAKMAKVLGPDRARVLLDRVLADLGVELRTADDLLRVSEAMSSLRGFEGAVGSMLGVAAVLRGARPAAGAPAPSRPPPRG